MYLLDTSVISAIVNTSSHGHAEAVAFRSKHEGEEQRLFVCVISLAEMRFGLGLVEGRTPKPSEADLQLVRQRIHAAAQISEPLEVTTHVAREQGILRAKWAWECSPTKAAAGKLKGAAPERWSDDWPATALQITENDIWIAAVALTHDMTVVALDKDFQKLARADRQLKVIQL
jgi:predicted nucleic acid-binding protein